MESIKLVWEDFKKYAEQNTNCTYRGHSNSEWKLIPTLGRFYNKNEVQAAAYHEILKSVHSDIKIKNSVEFSELNLPEESPFLNGLMYGNDAHEKELQRIFDCMIKLRHLGFPSPIIDLTKDHNVAAFFALSDIASHSHCCSIAIYCVKKLPPKPNLFKSQETKIFTSEFNFDEKNDCYKSDDSSYKSRHKSQKSSYMIVINHAAKDRCFSKEKQQGPLFLLSSIEETPSDEIEITKFIITDSKCKDNKLKFLRELYAKGLSYETIYRPTHILENSHLKDLAIKEILFSNKMNNIYYPYIRCSEI